MRNPQVPEGSLSIARIDVTLSNALLIVPSDQGIGLTMRKALSYSLTALSYVLMFLIMGLIGGRARSPQSAWASAGRCRSYAARPRRRPPRPSRPPHE